MKQIIDPAWDRFKARYMAPNPALVVGIVTAASDEEAERIVKQNPDVYVRVVVRGVVVSEYWGRNCA